VGAAVSADALFELDGDERGGRQEERDEEPREGEGLGAEGVVEAGT
jgi:hypothetical protein